MDKFEYRFKDSATFAPIAETESLTDYYVPAGSLGFSVMIFITCAILCVITLVGRRFVVGGELGGSNSGRLMSCAFLCSLWGFYLVMSILQAYKKFGLDKVTIGAIDEKDYSQSIKYWLVQCDKSFDYSGMSQ